MSLTLYNSAIKCNAYFQFTVSTDSNTTTIVNPILQITSQCKRCGIFRNLLPMTYLVSGKNVLKYKMMTLDILKGLICMYSCNWKVSIYRVTSCLHVLGAANIARSEVAVVLANYKSIISSWYYVYLVQICLISLQQQRTSFTIFSSNCEILK